MKTLNFKHDPEDFDPEDFRTGRNPIACER